MCLSEKRTAKEHRKCQDSVARFLKSGPWLKRKQVSGLRTQGFKHQHALLKNLKGRPEFGVGVHKGHLVVYFKIDLFLKIGLDKIVEGVLCMKKIANRAP